MGSLTTKAPIKLLLFSTLIHALVNKNLYNTDKNCSLLIISLNSLTLVAKDIMLSSFVNRVISLGRANKSDWLQMLKSEGDELYCYTCVAHNKRCYLYKLIMLWFLCITNIWIQNLKIEILQLWAGHWQFMLHQFLSPCKNQLITLSGARNMDSQFKANHTLSSWDSLGVF